MDQGATGDLMSNRTAAGTIHSGWDFSDVPPSRCGHKIIETLLYNDITAGCGAFGLGLMEVSMQ